MIEMPRGPWLTGENRSAFDAVDGRAANNRLRAMQIDDTLWEDVFVSMAIRANPTENGYYVSPYNKRRLN